MKPRRPAKSANPRPGASRPGKPRRSPPPTPAPSAERSYGPADDADEDFDDFEVREEDLYSLGVLRTPRSEQHLIDFWKPQPLASALCCTVGRAQFAAHLAQANPESRVVCNVLDLYAAEESRDYHRASAPNLEVTCETDLPAGEFDLTAVPITRNGEAELNREWLQQAHMRLKVGGTLLASSDNYKDTWLRDQLQLLFKHVERHSRRGGVVYEARKTAQLKRERDFESDFAFRDQGRLVKAISRPGVFSHRKLDLGARALLEVMEVREGDRFLDIGCGSGAVGLAAALRQPRVEVEGIDSNCRAIAALRKGAELNGLTTVTARLEAAGKIDSPASFDVAVGNPPYYSQYKIANLFVMAAHAALKPGGRVYMVSKQADWFLARMSQLFQGVEAVPAREYMVVRGTKAK